MDMTEDNRITEFLQGRIKIIQSREGYRFSVDAVLLADFIDEPVDNRIVDLGTGCGIIPIILAKERGYKNITGIEIQKQMAANAAKNVVLNRIEANIRIISGDFRSMAGKGRRLRFDAVISNPPYRKPGTGRINPKSEKAIARHEIACSLSEVIDAAASLSVKNGALYMIYHPFRLDELIVEMGKRGYHIERLRFVHPGEDESANLFLIKAVKNSTRETVIEPPVIIYESQDEYTPYLKSILGL